MSKLFPHHRGQMSEAFRTVMFLSASGGLQDAYTYIGHAIDYVTKKEKTEEKLVSGLH